MLHNFTLTAWGSVTDEIDTGGSRVKRWARLRLFGADAKFMTTVTFIAFEGVADEIVSYVSKGDRLIINAYLTRTDQLEEQGLWDAVSLETSRQVYIVQEFRFTAPGRIQRPILDALPPKIAGDRPFADSAPTAAAGSATLAEESEPDDDVPY